MYRKDSPATIQTMFNEIAHRYDRTNQVLSFSLHKVWNRKLVRHFIQRARSPQILLDLCAGTGDIAFEFLKQTLPPSQVYLIDFSTAMLASAKQKAAQLVEAARHQLYYLETDVQRLPLSDNFADCASMAYGIRNVKDPSLCLSDVFRVLKPGGFFAILELTRPKSSILRFGHQLYLRTFLPLLGNWLTNNRDAYQYLCQSIESFIEPAELENLFKRQGFVKTECLPLTGGIATIILGQKPK